MMRTFPFIEFKFDDGSQLQRDLPIVMSATSLSIEEERNPADSDQVFSTTITFTIKAHIIEPWIDPEPTSLTGPRLVATTPGAGINGGNFIIDPNWTEPIPYGYNVKPIRKIDISFENWYGAQYERLIIQEVTGGTETEILTGSAL
jgi:hypothetical protein